MQSDSDEAPRKRRRTKKAAHIGKSSGLVSDTEDEGTSAAQAAPERKNIPCNHHEDDAFNKENAETDLITFEKLDAVHVDFWPDDRLHLCYNSSTILDMARSMRPVPMFTLPPHFRERAPPECEFLRDLVKTLRAQGGCSEHVLAQITRGEVPELS